MAPGGTGGTPPASARADDGVRAATSCAAVRIHPTGIGGIRPGDRCWMISPALRADSAPHPGIDADQVPGRTAAGRAQAPDPACRRPGGTQITRPTVAAVRQVASVPATIDLIPSETISPRRCGHIVLMPPIMIPSEPKFAKPHSA